jgi:hypothetical protein
MGGAMNTDAAFARFRAAYPKRKGSQPWQTARKAFDKAVKHGANIEEIVAGALLYAAEQRDLKQVDTPFVCQATTFLNQMRWMDYESPSASTQRPLVWVLRDSSDWTRLSAIHESQHGKKPPAVPGDGGMGWHYPAEWVDTKRKAPGELHSATEGQHAIVSRANG